jgi:pilus assembly protein TadC
MTPQADAPGPGPERAAGPAGHAWHLVLGLTLWFVWFCATYGGVAVACAVAPPSPALGPMNWLNATVLLLAAACTCAFGFAAWLSARAARRRPAVAAGAAGAGPRFIARSASALYATAALSTALVALPAVLLAPCA